MKKTVFFCLLVLITALLTAGASAATFFIDFEGYNEYDTVGTIPTAYGNINFYMTSSPPLVALPVGGTAALAPTGDLPEIAEEDSKAHPGDHIKIVGFTVNDRNFGGTDTIRDDYVRDDGGTGAGGKTLTDTRDMSQSDLLKHAYSKYQSIVIDMSNIPGVVGFSMAAIDFDHNEYWHALYFDNNNVLLHRETMGPGSGYMGDGKAYPMGHNDPNIAKVVFIGSMNLGISDRVGFALDNIEVEIEEDCVIEIGDYCTQTQGGWGTDQCQGGNTACLLQNNWATVIGGNLVVGVGNTLTFSGASAVAAYLPAGGPANALTSSHTNPTSTEAGVLGGQVTALKLNVLFSDAGIGKIPPTGGLLRDLYIASGDFEGWTVGQFLLLAEQVLGGTSTAYSPSQVNEAASAINENFVDCAEDNGFLVIDPDCEPGPPGCEVIPLISDMVAGQHIDAGDVTIWNDDSNLYVRYETTGGWEMTETHLHVACSLEEIPQTKKGNPRPGHFAINDEHDPAITEIEYVFNLADFPCSTPLVAAHAVVQKEEILTLAPYYASAVVSYQQGLRKDGTNVTPARSVPEQGLAYETGQSESNFFSLGFGGWMIAEFSCPIHNGEGNDIKVIEDTWGTYPLEKAEVYASVDGLTWHYLGIADNTVRDPVHNIHTITTFDLGDLTEAKYIKIVDVTDPAVHNNNADGYDLNAIEALNNCVYIQEETAWGNEVGLPFPGNNWATYIPYGLQCIDQQEFGAGITALAVMNMQTQANWIGAVCILAIIAMAIVSIIAIKRK
ncbi:hypothetical protein KY349_00485 [Candidatus Woesearchaeota archaeon]|nr:hypothetical protein [Candidatus Woesearchaeota archaeon]